MVQSSENSLLDLIYSKVRFILNDSSFTNLEMYTYSKHCYHEVEAYVF